MVALWGVALAALSLTRDSTVILGLAAVWLAARERTRISYALVAVGAAASLPSPLILGAPLREAMAYTFENFYRPADASWHWVAGHYWDTFKSMAEHNLTYLWEHPYSGLYFVGGYLALFLIRSRGDRFVRFFRAAAVGSILLDALQPNYTAIPARADVRADRGRRPRRRPHARAVRRILDTNVLRLAPWRA